MPTASALRQCRRSLLDRHSGLDNRIGLQQTLVTLMALASIWTGIGAAASLGGAVSLAATVVLTALMSLLLLRVFVLMHECGHGSMFRSAWLNRAFGFALGVVAGMPQPVWSRNHQQHHLTNGNWQRYRGPLNIIPVDEYRRLSPGRQRQYRYARKVWLAPLGGFLYLIVWPRLNWLRASVDLARHVLAQMRADPGASLAPVLRRFQTPGCRSFDEYGQMSWNNLALLALWGAMVSLLGPGLFFACYVAALALAGGGAIVLFTVQHNFEHAYASADQGWERERGVLEGTSFLQLPAWLNWCTANIAYHHIHHLCARIPNYRLAQCHREQQHVFAGVQRIGLAQIPACLQFILWDVAASRLVSVAELRPAPLATAAD